MRNRINGLAVIFIIAVAGVCGLPRCYPDFAVIKLPENTQLMSQVALIHCRHDYFFDSPNLFYDVISGDEEQVFDVNSETGEITVAKPLQFNRTSSYTIVIGVYDDRYSIQRTDFTLFVEVLPTRENNLVFLNPNSVINGIPETSLGDVITTMQIQDRERSGEDIKFYLNENKNGGLFHIDRAGGGIYAVKPLDYETTSSHHLQVTAQRDISDDKILSATTNVTINLSDVNEYAPVCTPFLYVKLREDAWQNRKRGEMANIRSVCSEKDGYFVPNYPFMYNLFWRYDNTTFALRLTGKVRLFDAIDPDIADDTYFIEVAVREFGIRPKRTSTVAVLVHIEGVDDNPTFWPERNMSISIREDRKPNGDAIMTLKALDGDPSDRPEGQILYGMDKDDSDGFYVHAQGHIYLKRSLDRETCEEYVLNVFAFTQNNPDVRVPATVTIQIQDVNDNPPIFEKRVYHVKVLENEDYARVPLITVKANDADTGKNAEISYYLQGNSETPFAIDPLTGEITLTTALDFEKQSYHHLNIMSTDGVEEDHSDTTSVIVSVIPVNEHQPVIDNVTVVVPEDAPIGSLCSALTASDADHGPDGEIRFRSSSPMFPFHLDEQTGTIILVGKLDREVVDRYSFEVMVTDLSEANPKSSVASVVVTVSDTNDNSPVCDPPLVVVVLNTSLFLGQEVTSLNCTDADSKRNAELSYSIKSDEVEQPFVVDERGTVKIARQPMDDMYTFKVDVQDNGKPSLVYTVVLKIIVNSMKRPILDLPQVIDVLENTTIGSKIYTISCNTENPIFEISSGNEYSTFFIGESTGGIYLAGKIDREEEKSYTLEITVIDKDTWLTTSGYLTVNIEDVNDNPPKLSSNFYHLELSRHISDGFVVLKPNVTDADRFTNSRLFFSLRGTGSEDFWINETNGVIRFSGQFSTDKYFLTITVSDGGTPQLSNKAKLHVQVMETVKRPPSFPVSSYHVSVSENYDLAPIYVMQAYDVDDASSANEHLEYSITGGNIRNVFSINGSDGTVSVASSLDREDRDFYQLLIRCADNGDPSLFSTALLNVTILDANDNYPIFKPNRYIVRLPRTVEQGFIVGQVSATDEDRSINGVVVFTITEGNENNMFVIDAYSGVLKTALNLPALDGTLELTIQGADMGTPSLSSYAKFIIEIVSEAKYTFNVSENQPVGSFVGKVAEASGMIYTIIGGPSHMLFSIDKHDGSVLTTVELDREVTQEYQLTVLVQESARLWNMYRLLVTVIVLDENDNPPVFSEIVYSLNIIDTTPDGFDIFTLPVTDKDLNENSLLHFEVNAEDNNIFGVRDSTYQLYVKDSRKLQQRSFFNVNIYASDRGTPQRSGETTVRINIVPSTPSTKQDSFYLSLECPLDAQNGYIVHKLTTDLLHMEKTNLTKLEFISEDISETPFLLRKDSGEIEVQNDQRLEENATLMFWVVARAFYDSNFRRSHQGIVRIDTYNPLKTLVNIHTNIPADSDNTSSAAETFVSELNLAIEGATAHLFKTQPELKRSREKRSLSNGTVLLLYAVNSTAGDPYEDLAHEKIFISNEDLKALIQSKTNDSTFGKYRIVSLDDRSLPIASGQFSRSTTDGLLVGLICMAGVLSFFTITLIIMFLKTGKIRNLPRSDNQDSDLIEEFSEYDDQASDKDPVLPNTKYNLPATGRMFDQVEKIGPYNTNVADLR